MRELMGAGGYVGVDIDPSVVAQNRKDFPAEPWYQADGELTHIADESQDAIVSSFVFHFRLTRHHMLTMRRILKPTGFILGNVYRRSPRSRQELALRFERVGLRVHRRKDEAELCTDHEFWCLVPDGHPHPEMTAGVLDEVASIIGSSGDRASSSYPAAGRRPES
jgi:SAM-dependent methyltransferase